MEYTRLNTGIEVPVVGLGLWGTKEKDTISSVCDAIDLGYRLIDTASFYENEQFVAAGVKESGILRSDVFLATKVWFDDMEEGKVEASLEKSLQNLDTDYIDLFLLHWPMGDIKYSWKYLESMYEQGVIKNIGVSNFQKHHLEKLSTYANIQPAINQIESNPEFQQDRLVKYCQSEGIAVQAWGPLGKGRSLQNPLLVEMAEKHGCSVAQVILRWHFERGVMVIPKSIHKERLIENMDIFGFSLDESDKEQLQAMETGVSHRGYQPGYTWK